MNLFSLENKRILVTGAAQGIGFIMARGLAQHGAEIIINGTSEERAENAAMKLRDEGFTAHTAVFNVADPQGVEAGIEKIESTIGPIDVLFNNAGIQLRKPLTELAVDEWHRVLDTNLTSAFLVGREAAKRMIARGNGGKIINIGSLTSECARATVAPYTVSKGGIKMLTRAMTAEWAANKIQINAIGPGYMATDMNEALLNNPQFDGWVKSRTPAGRWGLPQELAGAAIFLASRASDYVNGQIIYVDGGMLAVL